jgi:LysM repeat protein
VRQNAYELRVPAGTAAAVTDAHAATAPAEAASLQYYAVRKGETLLGIARKLRVSRTDLAEANYLSTRARVTVGQRLIIPRPPALLLATTPDNPAPAPESRPADVVRAGNTTPAAAQNQPASVLYRVKRGDTLFAIARVYRTTVAAIKTWNSLRSNSIQIGQRLTIFPRQTAATATN